MMSNMLNDIKSIKRHRKFNVRNGVYPTHQLIFDVKNCKMTSKGAHDIEKL